MAYIINKFNGEQLIVLEDGTINTSTSLGLVGRNYVGYGETQNENFVFLLENFANDDPPARPLTGQIWFDTTTNLANVYDGEKWIRIGAAILSNDPPPEPSVGALWLRTPVNTLNVWTGSNWGFIGPEAVPGFGTTRARAGSLEDSDGNTRPVIFLDIDGITTAICTNTAFVIDATNSIPGFTNNLVAGINLRSSVQIQGNITGSATTANRLTTGRLINNATFDGQSDITIKAATTNKLKKGSYISGIDFDGSVETTWSVDASPANLIGKVVARNSSGDFAAGNITANLIGNVTGNVTAASGTSSFNVVQANTFIGATLTGTANAARQLALSPKINGVTFTGLQDITIGVEANTLTGNQLAANVVNSNLETVGSLINLTVLNWLNVGNSGIQSNLASPLTGGLQTTLYTSDDNLTFIVPGAAVSITSPANNLLLGGSESVVAFIPTVDNGGNLGNPNRQWNKVYANTLVGNADTATLATRSTNIVGGGAGAIPYQTAANTTSMLGLGADGYVLKARPGGPTWEAIGNLGTPEVLTKGSYLTLVNTITSAALGNWNGNVAATIAVDASSSNTAGKVVVRDGSGNFAAGTITAGLIGNVSGNASTATKLATARSINGVPFDGSSDITVTSSDNSRVSKSGDSMSGYLTLNGNPVSALHATPKQYVDSRLPQYTFTYGVSTCVGYTNQVGSFNNSSNYFDVFPPSGKNMGDLVAFIPSLNTVHYAGGVDGNDSIRTQYSTLGDRIRVWVQNTEQRSTPSGNFLAIWS